MDAKRSEQHVVLVDEYRKAAVADEVSAVAYKGLRIHALPGLHEFTYEVLQQYARPGEAVLDLAAGSGAMSLRLADGGYQVTATDYVEANFRLHGQIPFVQADLNDDFSVAREQAFDVIVASEIIEHLENPRHFMRQCHRLLKPGGRLVLSTPNIDTSASLVTFMREGSFQWFTDRNYQCDGHITPLSQWQLEKCAHEAGFGFVWKGSYGDRDQLIEGSPRLILLSWLFNKLMTRAEALKNQIFVAVLAR